MIIQKGRFIIYDYNYEYLYKKPIIYSKLETIYELDGY